ncbi:hypothetical protein GCM10010990_10280 [Croceicoccus mobilis]|uniref:OmpR/PhoB-type domain-containing protein n=1 Tax=Croceicoccus mobilis TaxID=1703339 RepID=A0A916YVR3_9SPHN|nr:hypothetical protein GCM10010990_10280 [Croceicoccus mobilis]
MPDFDPKLNTDSGITQLSSADLGEWRAAATNLGTALPAIGACCVSLSDANANARIVAARSAGRAVLALATRAQTRARQAALKAGASEFLTTGPILPAELLARVTLLATGSALPDGLSLRASHLEIADKAHPLQERETAIMAMLIAAKGGFVTHESMLTLWGENADDRQYLRVAIAKLRRRIEPEPDLPRFILSEPGIGYRMGNGMACTPPG